MPVDKILVLLGGLAAIAWINWYFFVAGRRRIAVAAGGALQEIEIVVAGGYDPAAIRLAHGRPARLVFDRRETSSCSEELVIPDLGIRRFLPAHERTTVDVPATVERGTHEFTCGMGMLRGRLIVE
jgi:plastocyanin domain-containing protein